MTQTTKFRSAHLADAFRKCFDTYGPEVHRALTGMQYVESGPLGVAYPDEYAARLMAAMSGRLPDPADYLCDRPGLSEAERTPPVAEDLMGVIAQLSLAMLALRFLDPKNMDRQRRFRLLAVAARDRACAGPTDPAAIFATHVRTAMKEVRQIRDELADEWKVMVSEAEDRALRLVPRVLHSVD